MTREKGFFFPVSELPGDYKHGVPELDHPGICDRWGDGLPSS